MLQIRLPRKKSAPLTALCTPKDANAPHWEAPNGPPGGHFRAEEASPENLKEGICGLKTSAVRGDVHSRPIKSGMSGAMRLPNLCAAKPFCKATACF